MSRGRVLFFVATATVLASAVLLFARSELTWLRVFVGLPFILLLPGQAMMLLADPHGRLGALEWFALSVGASISVVLAVGMGIASVLPLTGDATIVALTVVTLCTLAVAGLRTAAAARELVGPVRRRPIRRIMVGALALVACGMFVLALSIPRTSSAPDARIVQLWGLRTATDGLRIGTTNVNATSRRYRLHIEQGGRLIAQRDLDLPAGTSHIFEVKKSATWTQNAPVVAVLTDVTGVVAPRAISVWAVE